MRVFLAGAVLTIGLVVGSTTQAQIVISAQVFGAESPPSEWSTSQNTPWIGAGKETPIPRTRHELQLNVDRQRLEGKE